MLDLINKRLKELNSAYDEIEKKHEANRRNYEYRPDSIKAKEAVISDENSAYISELLGGIKELESLLRKLWKYQII